MKIIWLPKGVFKGQILVDHYFVFSRHLLNVTPHQIQQWELNRFLANSLTFTDGNGLLAANELLVKDTLFLFKECVLANNVGWTFLPEIVNKRLWFVVQQQVFVSRVSVPRTDHYSLTLKLKLHSSWKSLWNAQTKTSSFASPICLDFHSHTDVWISIPTLSQNEELQG